MEGMNSAPWRTSSYSGNNGGACVEVGQAACVVLVRDTRNRDGAALSIPADAWRRFIRATK